MVNTSVELEVLEEKMPESPWHNEKVRECEDMLREAVKSLPTAVSFMTFSFTSEVGVTLPILPSSFKAHRP